jgi:hypothetical protein
MRSTTDTGTVIAPTELSLNQSGKDFFFARVYKSSMHQTSRRIVIKLHVVFAFNSSLQATGAT